MCVRVCVWCSPHGFESCLLQRKGGPPEGQQRSKVGSGDTRSVLWLLLRKYS